MPISIDVNSAIRSCSPFVCNNGSIMHCLHRYTGLQ